MAEDDPLAKLGRDLNEDAKAARKRKTGAQAKADAAAHLSGEPATADEGLTSALANLGESVSRQEGAGTDGLDLSEGAHTLAIDRMETMATEAVLSNKALIYDVRDFLLNQIKARPKPWSATSTGEQRDVAAACEHSAHELVRKIVEAVASQGKQTVRVLLTKVTIGDDMVIAGKVKTFEEDEEDRAVVMLHAARGKHVLLTVASPDDFKGEAREAEVDEDEPQLGFEAGTDDHPEDDSDLNPED